MSTKEWGIFAGVIVIGLSFGYAGSLMLIPSQTRRRDPSFVMPESPDQGNPERSSDSDYKSARGSISSNHSVGGKRKTKRKSSRR